VIEYLLADRRHIFSPLIFFAAGVFYVFLSALVALALFPSQASVAHILLATVAVSPILFRAVVTGAQVLDENPNLVLVVQSWLAVLYFSYMLGALLGFQLSYFLLPEKERIILMEEQLREIQIIEGVRISLTGMATKESAFWYILENNLRVYVISIFLSFFYGTGGMLLLNWNASIIAALFFKKLVEGTPEEALSLLSIIPHGFFEFLGYFTGGITGILIGVAIIQEGWNRRLLRDVLILVALGFLFIVLGAAIEVGLI